MSNFPVGLGKLQICGSFIHFYLIMFSGLELLGSIPGPIERDNIDF